MKTRHTLASLLLAFGAAAGAAPAPAGAPSVPGEAALQAARHAVSAHRDDVVETLAKLVSYNTVADKDLPAERNPQFLGFKNFLKGEATRLGLDFADHGQVLVIGLGAPDAPERVGMVAHGDVQPVDASKWKKSPFELDRTSEPGKLLARGAEDDKGPIATALYAMKSLKELQLPLSRRIELIVYMAEESDWDPLVAFVKTHPLPQVNITLDAEYPAVTAEKGYGTVALTFPPAAAAPPGEPYVASFGGGFFGSQIPEDAQALIANAGPALEAQLKQRAAKQAGMHYSFERKGSDLAITAKGVSAHSSKPEDGLNAISMLADALSVQAWPDTPSGAMVNFLNEMVGTGYFGEKFGNIAYRDGFMGPMTFAPTVIRQKGESPELSINLRRPRGKTAQQLSNEINAALAQWQGAHASVQLLDTKVQIGDPWIQHDAPQLPVLMKVFSYFTGVKDPKPVAIGGGTNSRLFPRAVSFGPAMPHTVYTGHSEHEFITLKQLLLNLEMLTAVLAELAQ
ncbi:dipeptidase [Massilia sp. LXY-6]|uniref:dipeptidase n=1 Tax=Massilia sp. LXY-6 TaxID=3379823 RepID=UPI003EE2D80B